MRPPPTVRSRRLLCCTPLTSAVQHPAWSCRPIASRPSSRAYSRAGSRPRSLPTQPARYFRECSTRSRFCTTPMDRTRRSRPSTPRSRNRPPRTELSVRECESMTAWPQLSTSPGDGRGSRQLRGRGSRRHGARWTSRSGRGRHRSPSQERGAARAGLSSLGGRCPSPTTMTRRTASTRRPVAHRHPAHPRPTRRRARRSSPRAARPRLTSRWRRRRWRAARLRELSCGMPTSAARRSARRCSRASSQRRQLAARASTRARE